MVSMEQTSNKEMNFDLNLVPFIDILSTCICFLLMTTVWIHIGVFNVSQAIGSEPPAGKNPPSVIVDIKNGGAIQFSLKDVPGRSKPVATDVGAGGNGIDWNRVDEYVASLASRMPDVKTVLVMPSSRTKYEDVIRMMDTFKRNQIDQVGISPLSGQ